MIYTDGKKLLTKGSIEVLHKFAHYLGIKRETFRIIKKKAFYPIDSSKVLDKIKRVGVEFIEEPFSYSYC